MSRQRAWFLYAAVLLLTSCRPHLPVRVVLDRMPVERGLPSALITSGEGRYVDPNGGAVSPGEILRPGDVLYVGRWWPSTLDRTKHTFQWSGPQTFIERIPLRYVNPTDGSLKPYERAFLATVLSVQRSEAFNAVNTQGDPAAHERLLRFRNALAKNEVTLWNALVQSLKAKVVDYSANDAASAHGPEGSEPNVFVTVSTPELARVLEQITAPEDQGDHSYSHYIRVGELELFAIDEGFHSPWDTLIGVRRGYPFTANAEFYATQSSEAEPVKERQDFVEDAESESRFLLNCTSTTLDEVATDEEPSTDEEEDVTTDDEESATDEEESNVAQEVRLKLDCDPPSLPAPPPAPVAPAGVPHATFNFYDVDLDGISMALPGNEERRWTLADWNDSQVCRTTEGIPAMVEQVLFKGSTAPYRIVAEEDATHEVVPAFRRERIVNVKPRACTACNNIRSIARSDLRRLYVSDLRAVLWTYEEELTNGASRKTKKRVLRIPNCSPR